ncbi:hypothetical protein [Comamonas koreensis]|uniref:Uncharacterized protein n=1 Tax=Comamonas koreensis TaxID=160825 RepID=A0AAW4XUE0_9BURK|nr:hypothetical protein [Comamonas koreensis]MCD2164331.1 hypothetical protein [Comamonas koreensis]
MREFMPILRNPDFRLPWSMIAPHEKQAQANHGGQTLERLAERGGLSFCEAAAIMEDRRWSRIVWNDGQQHKGDPARVYLEKLIAQHAQQREGQPAQAQPQKDSNQ